MLYKQAVTTKEKALCHLLLFFSLFEDETFKGEETYQVFSILKSYPITAHVDFPEEVNVFFDYKSEIGDTLSYFHYLIHLIGHDYPLLTFFHAAQVALSDTIFSIEDNEYLSMLRMALNIDKEAGATILELALAERNMKLTAS